MDNIALNFLIAISIGIILGLEREIAYKRDKIRGSAGIRTFILFSIFGFLIAHISINVLNSITLFIVGFAAFILMIIAAYLSVAIKTGKLGATTETASILTFILAAMVALNNTQLQLMSAIIAVIVAAVLALKENLHKIAKNIKSNEVYAAIKLAVISIIILPFLPNKSYTLLEIPYLKELILTSPSLTSIVSQLAVFNPFTIWLLVVFISALSFIGYILVKTVGANKGIGLTSFLGGIVSSTATTVSLAEKSKGKKTTNPFVFGIILASSIMFIRILILVAAINSKLVKFLIVPLGLMALTSFIGAFIISRKKENTKEKMEFSSPFALKPALKFGLFFVIILALSKILYLFLGNSGAYIASLVSGLVDVDAIVLSLSTFSSSGTIAERVAVLGTILAIFANTIVKAGITYVMGEKKVAKKVIIIFAITLVVGIISALLI